MLHCHPRQAWALMMEGKSLKQVAAMSNDDPGELVSIIKWTRGTGPAQVVGQFRDGQAVKIRNGEVVAV